MPLEDDFQGLIQLLELLRFKAADAIGQQGVRQAHHLLKEDVALVPQSLVRADGNLGRQTLVGLTNRGTDDSRETGIDQCLPAHEDDDATP